MSADKEIEIKVERNEKVERTEKVQRSDKPEERTKWSLMDKALIASHRQHVFALYISDMIEQVLAQKSKISEDKDHVFFKPELKDFYNVGEFRMKGHIIHYGHPKPDGRWTERTEFPEGMPFRSIQKILVSTHRLYLTDVSDSSISKNLVFCLSNKFHRSERKLWHGYQFVPMTKKQIEKKNSNSPRVRDSDQDTEKKDSTYRRKDSKSTYRRKDSKSTYRHKDSSFPRKDSSSHRKDFDSSSDDKEKEIIAKSVSECLNNSEDN
jgi:hypothetical protein